jgi:hypothetical protein
LSDKGREMITNILIGLGIGLILGILIGGIVGLVAGYDWRAGHEARGGHVVKVIESIPDDEGKPAPAIWLPHVKGPME